MSRGENVLEDIKTDTFLVIKKICSRQLILLLSIIKFSLQKDSSENKKIKYLKKSLNFVNNYRQHHHQQQWTCLLPTMSRKHVFRTKQFLIFTFRSTSCSRSTWNTKHDCVPECALGHEVISDRAALSGSVWGSPLIKASPHTRAKNRRRNQTEKLPRLIVKWKLNFTWRTQRVQSGKRADGLF